MISSWLVASVLALGHLQPVTDFKNIVGQSSETLLQIRKHTSTTAIDQELPTQ
jgi:uncharacterized membrane protein required for colicin V production